MSDTIESLRQTKGEQQIYEQTSRADIAAIPTALVGR
jgi:hypothetical protein